MSFCKLNRILSVPKTVHHMSFQENKVGVFEPFVKCNTVEKKRIKIEPKWTVFKIYCPAFSLLVHSMLSGCWYLKLSSISLPHLNCDCLHIVRATEKCLQWYWHTLGFLFQVRKHFYSWKRREFRRWSIIQDKDEKFHFIFGSCPTYWSNFTQQRKGAMFVTTTKMGTISFMVFLPLK